MKLFYTDEFVLHLPAGHTFPMAKYRLLRERVLASGFVPPDALHVPPAATDEQLARAHDESYIQAMSMGRVTDADMKRIGFPWSLALVERSRRSSGATIEACRAALSDGVSVNLAGGTHHAFRDHGEGYCLFNDSVVAARAMQAEGLVERVVVIDLDVHQGNGTAAICRFDPTIYTFSVHGAKNFPLRKEQSDLDLELPDGTTDAAYLDAVIRGLRRALDESLPDLAIYLAGSDPFERDRLGRLKVTKAGLAERDRLVFEACERAGLPMAVTMAGGYAKDVTDTVDIHWQTVRRAIEKASGAP
ncbi:MAG TPA: histone deacetylase [Gemmataceae bacterium]|nr:histone deacetylase [Gemmataceae bacterium]